MICRIFELQEFNIGSLLVVTGLFPLTWLATPFLKPTLRTFTPQSIRVVQKTDTAARHDSPTVLHICRPHHSPDSRT